MIIELVIILAVGTIQIIVFRNVAKRISKLKHFFPKGAGIKVTSTAYHPDQLNDHNYIDKLAEKPLSGINDQIKYGSNAKSIQLLKPASELAKKHPEFRDVIISTNLYLLKNSGNAANFEILKDICERKVDIIKENIASSINTPLFLGLVGTFGGIIYGLVSLMTENTLDQASSATLSEGVNQTLSNEGIKKLLTGVAIAMGASLLGLLFTIINSTVLLRKADYQVENQKNDYFNTLQRELLPYLNRDVNEGLASLKSVLSHFIGKFGDSMSDYKDSAKLLNENLREQKELLKEVNELKVLDVSKQIAKVFVDLKDSSESLSGYKKHVTQLNKSITNASKVVVNMQTAIDEFSEFNTNLKHMSVSLNGSIEVQNQLKSSLEKHFPTIDDHRLIWRKSMDELNGDVNAVYAELVSFFKNSTEVIQEFATSNSEYFTDKATVVQVLTDMKTAYDLNSKDTTQLHAEMAHLRNDLNANANRTLETHKLILEEIKMALELRSEQQPQPLPETKEEEKNGEEKE
jgi:hypothetical protein